MIKAERVLESTGQAAVEFGGVEKAPAPLGGALKRALDIVVAGTALVVLWPLMLMVMLTIRLTDPGPVIFGHERIGFNGRRFRCKKFRSMVTNADVALQRLLERDPVAAQEWAETQKLRNDPRITRIGRILRETSLDELPQLWNVLKGEMSIVGPRPIVNAEVRRYAHDFGAYVSTRPGITGLWQVTGRSDCSYEERVALDVDYVRNWTIWRDIAIIAKTFHAVLARKGSY